MVYDVVDGQAMGETHYTAAGTATMYMMYIHDENGAVNGIGLWYPGDTEWTYYYFVKSLQGDVLEIYSENHNCVAFYTYDSWGNVLSKSGTLADINPFRYRGYYFDNESWFYYLQSRYYDPAIGRFVNADVLTSTGQGILGNNMFAYCGNNPITRADSCGFSHKDVLRESSDGGPSASISSMMLVSSFALGNFLLNRSIPALNRIISQTKRDVYEFAKSLQDSAAGLYENHQPRVHHIVPPGTFSNRNATTRAQIAEMQDILNGVGIDPASDPLNMVVISHGYHKSIHTNSYYSTLHAQLKTAASNREEVVRVLFYNRITITFSDYYSLGF